MGAGASVPDKIDEATCKTLAGDKFDQVGTCTVGCWRDVAHPLLLCERGVYDGQSRCDTPLGAAMWRGALVDC